MFSNSDLTIRFLVGAVVCALLLLLAIGGGTGFVAVLYLNSEITSLSTDFAALSGASHDHALQVYRDAQSAFSYFLVACVVITVFATLPNTKIEFIQPLGEDSPITKFVERNPDGGIHHVCYEVPEIIAARDKLIAEGARVLGDGNPKIGAHGKPVLFLHPKDFSGALVEIEQS